MRAGQRIAALLAGLGVALFGGGTAHAGPLCPPSATGPWEYQATLGPLVNDPGPAPPMPPSPPGAPARPPAPPPPPPRSGPGAFTVAQNALGTQYAGAWLHSGVQGWVIGVAPGPLGSTRRCHLHGAACAERR